MVLAGTLVVNGSLSPSSVVSLSAGAILGGTGVVRTASTALASSVNPSILNQPVTFTAIVRPDAILANATGSVDFMDMTTNTDLGAVAVLRGTASLKVSSLGVGNHVIDAIYSGDLTFLASSAMLTQAVHYNFSGFIGPLQPGATYKLGRTLPIKFQLTDFYGTNISDLGAVKSFQIQKVNAQGQPLAPPSNPLGAGGTALRYDTTANQFVFNWKTKGLDSGRFEILLTLADGTVQTLFLQLR
jgi:hypothetical protein